ncbi:unnamed protein product [Vitrella brassicaformis CCMP3155]|uniref:Uncharacterized protein n=1 Tax=Vitrella brassicaformis (strain CCMP3155) TaxID=1169540 RepID=A0A0G4GEB7_VITBC|nr:unnamed protein product [Vitrella brassicaformis CCMP3155]|eukprot:CEM27677.1 unnamed protein product [Vitrella brassicaformis CCMP3155]
MAQEKATVHVRVDRAEAPDKNLLYTKGERRYARDRRPTKYTDAHQLMEHIRKEGLKEKMTVEFAGGRAEPQMLDEAIRAGMGVDWAVEERNVDVEEEVDEEEAIDGGEEGDGTMAEKKKKKKKKIIIIIIIIIIWCCNGIIITIIIFLIMVAYMRLEAGEDCTHELETLKRLRQGTQPGVKGKCDLTDPNKYIKKEFPSLTPFGFLLSAMISGGQMVSEFFTSWHKAMGIVQACDNDLHQVVRHIEANCRGPFPRQLPELLMDEINSLLAQPVLAGTNDKGEELVRSFIPISKKYWAAYLSVELYERPKQDFIRLGVGVPCQVTVQQYNKGIPAAVRPTALPPSHLSDEQLAAHAALGRIRAPEATEHLERRRARQAAQTVNLAVTDGAKEDAGET